MKEMRRRRRGRKEKRGRRRRRGYPILRRETIKVGEVGMSKRLTEDITEVLPRNLIQSEETLLPRERQEARGGRGARWEVGVEDVVEGNRAKGSEKGIW